MTHKVFWHYKENPPFFFCYVSFSHFVLSNYTTSGNWRVHGGVRRPGGTSWFQPPVSVVTENLREKVPLLLGNQHPVITCTRPSPLQVPGSLGRSKVGDRCRPLVWVVVPEPHSVPALRGLVRDPIVSLVQLHHTFLS